MKHGNANIDAVLRRVDDGDKIISLIRPELRLPLRQFRIRMRFHAFLKICVCRCVTMNELSELLGLPEEILTTHLLHPPENPLGQTLLESERHWLHEYYRGGQKVRSVS
ncbi:MAG: hypothetical protein A3D65_02775 [Candidatus Lloydbacteria bacterium RIFCSPHIGHO2_02_FULL_50_13]|uniref:Uncharacterized protein n=1 Tax=Candidatus Lloydbacteria bacterium RIFCSPHIGHO2_02_FULL_50_13 TaxID=1798661 RepID=A0A1G2D5P4_9BACT|nr:MAG: hypothetical protein A3D65_02775 [Candidatus Lloydbacteria bacterium RIFCSPHIGHO2_02_FULL_50_13]